MKHPYIRPAPLKPNKPVSTIISAQTLYLSNYTNLQQLINSLPKDLTFSNVCIETRGWGGHDIYYYKTIENKQYKSQLARYQKDMKKYNSDILKYEEELKVYKQELKQWKKWHAKNRYIQAKKHLNKLEKELNKIEE